MAIFEPGQGLMANSYKS